VSSSTTIPTFQPAPLPHQPSSSCAALLTSISVPSTNKLVSPNIHVYSLGVRSMCTSSLRFFGVGRHSRSLRKQLDCWMTTSIRSGCFTSSTNMSFLTYAKISNGGRRIASLTKMSLLDCTKTSTESGRFERTKLLDCAKSSTDCTETSVGRCDTATRAQFPRIWSSITCTLIDLSTCLPTPRLRCQAQRPN
jgi:hypothetical protein